MNYTEHDDERPFVTKKALATAAKLAPISIAIASFMASHTLSLMRDPETQKPVTVAAEKDDDDKTE